MTSRSLLTAPSRRVTAAAVVLAVSIPLAACGGSSAVRPSGGSASGPGVKFAACIRAHGVPSYSDSGDAVVSSGNTTAGTATVSGQAVPERVLTAAQDKCIRYDTQITDQPKFSSNQIAKLQADSLAFSRCMRAHGVLNYPDFRVTPGYDGRGTRFSVVGKAPGPYSKQAFPTAVKACYKLNSYYP